MTTKTTIDEAEFTRRWNRNDSYEKIGEYFGISTTTVSTIRRNLSLPRRVQPITEAKLAKMKEMLEDGISYTEIQRTLNISRTTVARYFPDQGWSYADGGRFAMLKRYRG